MKILTKRGELHYPHHPKSAGKFSEQNVVGVTLNRFGGMGKIEKDVELFC